MDLNLRQLKTFLGVVRFGSFAAAAKHLYATQSAISVRIHELEQALGVPLFVRGHQRVNLTPNGRALVPYAEQLLALAASIPQEIGDPQATTGVIRLGVCEPVALTWLPALVVALRERLPKVGIEVDKDLTGNLMKKLQDGQLDLALVAGPAPGFNYASLSLGSVDFAWVASSKFSTGRGTLTPEDISRMPLLSLSEQPYEYPAIEKWLAQAPQHRYVLICNDIGVVIRLLAEDVGVSLLAEVCCREQIRAGALQVLDTTPKVPAVEFFAVWRQARNQPLIARIGALAADTSEFRRDGKAPRARGPAPRAARKTGRAAKAPA